ncbi:MAG: UbiA family prenyltransferase [Dehalococcoidales bacterium]|nr:UbiA family prenyltransferase [Dehalococcoidales bacterium]
MSLSITAGVGRKIKSLLGFSRVLQATLSVAQPFVAGLIALHGFPSLERTVLALTAGWAGFMAVFALNDLLDVDLDKRRFAHLRGYEGFDIDSAMARHPLALRQITFSLGTLWIGAFAAYALVGGYILNPMAPLIFVVAALLEIAYCKLARVTERKFLVSGAMVGIGALAGWVALTPEVRAWEMGLILIWMFAWEIGGRNIVNDFADVEEDGRLGIRTVPLAHGPRAAARLAFAFLVLTFLASLALQPLSQLNLLYLVGAVVAGLWLLIWPGLKLLASPVPPTAMAVFNRASLYPPAMLAVVLVSLYWPL